MFSSNLKLKSINSRLKCEISEHMFSHAHRPDLPSGYRKVITLKC